MMKVIVEVCLHSNRVVEENRDHFHASTALNVDDVASRSGRANLQTGVILHLLGGYRGRNLGHVRQSL